MKIIYTAMFKGKKLIKMKIDSNIKSGSDAALRLAETEDAIAMMREDERRARIVHMVTCAKIKIIN